MPNGENMRVKKAKKNVLYGIITYVFLMILTFVNRKIFINVLGQNMAGLQGVLLNILSFLNLVESGVGMAIMFSLYKPFAEDNKVQIKSILTLYSRIYKFCGIVILILGIVLSNYLGIFVKGQLDLDYVKICFLLYIIDTIITYFFSYKTCLLYASQNGYIISLWDFNFKAVRYVVQILVLFVYKSFFVFILIQLITNILYLVTINYIINKKFPWVSEVKATNIEGKDNIIRNIKALFMHKIGGFVVFSTDNLLISYFLDLKTAGLYVNYSMILSFCSNFTNKIFDGINASIGNLLAERNSEKSYEVFKKIFFFNFWLSSFICIALYNTIDSFIALWLGEEFVLNNTVVVVLLLNLYISIMRVAVDRFKESGGLYYADRYVPLFEVIINLVFSIVLVKKVGLAGVFIGTLISNLSVVFWVKPKIVFNQVFNKSLLEYFSNYLKYLSFGVIAFLVTRTMYYFINFNNGISGFLLNCILNVILINTTYLIIFHNSEEFLYYKNVILKKLGRG